MNTTFVYVVHHVRELSPGVEDVKLIGVYSSEALGRQAIERLRKVAGFRDCPDGFSIDGYRLDEDHWKEGFVTV